MAGNPGKTFERRAARLRRGILYHGTTRSQAEDIVQHGFRLIPYDDIVKDVLAKLRIEPERIGRQRRKAIEAERTHYECAGTHGEPMISSAPSPEIASRWAGSGGEVAKSIERIITGRRAEWRDPRSPLSGEPVVLELTLNAAGRQSPNFLSYLEYRNRLDLHIQNGRVSAADALDDLINQYMDIKLMPNQIGRVTILRKFNDQGGDYRNWLRGTVDFFVDKT